MSQAAVPFQIDVPDATIADLRDRLRRTRYARPLLPDGSSGFEPAYLAELVRYWAENFDWPAVQAELNAYPQYLSDGIHFVHLRRHSGRLPVLLTHGWPSTFVELLPLADRLDADVIIPSLPGYLWSRPLAGPATREAIGESFHHLMRDVLGYERYVAFGGDIGGAACGWLAINHPDEVAGLHVIHGPFPATYTPPITPAERRWLESEDERERLDGGYAGMLATRPDTLTAALIDSPAGLAAYIWDKLRDWADCGGVLEARFSKRDLCTIATLYWVTDSIGTSMRQDFDAGHARPKPPIEIPVAVAQSREWNMPLFPRSIAERAARDLRRWTTAPAGGHFMAFEEPDFLAGDITAFLDELGS